MAKEQEQSINSPKVIITPLNEQECIGLTITDLIDKLDNPQVLVVDGKN